MFLSYRNQSDRFYMMETLVVKWLIFISQKNPELILCSKINSGSSFCNINVMWSLASWSLAYRSKLNIKGWQEIAWRIIVILFVIFHVLILYSVNYLIIFWLSSLWNFSLKAFSTNVRLMQKRGSWVLLGKCL